MKKKPERKQHHVAIYAPTKTAGLSSPGWKVHLNGYFAVNVSTKAEARGVVKRLEEALEHGPLPEAADPLKLRAEIGFIRCILGKQGTNDSLRAAAANLIRERDALGKKVADLLAYIGFLEKKYNHQEAPKGKEKT